MIAIRVCSHVPNIQNPKCVIHVYDQAVFVPAYVENDAISPNKARMPVLTLNVLGAIPRSL